MRRAVLFALLLCAAPARAVVVANNYAPTDLGISAAQLTTGPSFTVRSDGFNALTVYAQYTRGSASSVTMTCTGGPSPTVQAPVGVANISGGSIVNSPATFSYAVSASGNLRWVVAPLNDQWMTCTFGATGGNASDLISTYARLGGVP